MAGTAKLASNQREIGCEQNKQVLALNISIICLFIVYICQTFLEYSHNVHNQRQVFLLVLDEGERVTSLKRTAWGQLSLSPCWPVENKKIGPIDIWLLN